MVVVGSPFGESACDRLEPFGLWLTRSGLLGTPVDWGFNTEYVMRKNRVPDFSWDGGRNDKKSILDLAPFH